MRITIISAEDISKGVGRSNRILDYNQELSAKHEVFIITRGKKILETQRTLNFANTKIPGIRQLALHLEILHQLFLTRPDMIICMIPLPTLMLPALFYRFLNRKTLIVTDIGDIVLEPKNMTDRLFVFFENMAIKKSDHLISTSGFITNEVAKKGKDAVTILTQFNISKSIKSPNKIIRLIYGGSISRAQGLFEMLSLITGSKAEFELDIYGKGEQLQEVIQIGEKDKRIRYRGFIDKKEYANMLGRYDFGLVCLDAKGAFKYAVPGKALEYIANDLPIIFYGSGEIGSIVSKNGLGYIISSKEDMEGIAKISADEYIALRNRIYDFADSTLDIRKERLSATIDGFLGQGHRK